jgi:hypothetical protein
MVAGCYQGREQVSEKETHYSWSLGDDTDCDTCGFSWNEIGVEIWDEDENIIQLWTRVGCYGGTGELSTYEDWDAYVEETITYALSYSGFTKADAKDLRSKIALFLEGNK